MLISLLGKEIRNFSKLSSDMKMEKEFQQGILTTSDIKLKCLFKQRDITIYMAVRPRIIIQQKI